MKSLGSFLVIVSAVGLCLSGTAGCGSSSDDVKPEVKKEVGDLGAAARAAGGDYSKLSPADQQAALKMAGGNEGVAKGIVSTMAHPPSEMNAGKGPKAPGN
jgi:hypothetical protein